MTPEQETHVKNIADGFKILMANKYRRGVEEHGGNIWDNDVLLLLEQAIEENIDQFVYLFTARQKLLDQI